MAQHDRIAGVKFGSTHAMCGPYIILDVIDFRGGLGPNSRSKVRLGGLNGLIHIVAGKAGRVGLTRIRNWLGYLIWFRKGRIWVDLQPVYNPCPLSPF